MSQAASGLLRALIARSGVTRDRILLSDVKSVDWQSLTFTGERHRLSLRCLGNDARSVIERICSGLENAEIAIPGAIVADIAVVGEARTAPGGATDFTIEALTVADD